ncbi:MAG: DUF4340 domain-containing protein, partial [Candidatus Krumholzibacteria bacterium]|nr:DUF4340 domain-containing protein [Candidatus Krumholzibacteria bacterium]
KTASTRHTFVRLDDDHRVYQARGDIRRPFDLEVDKLRDKSVVKFDRETVTGITVASGEGSLLLNKTDASAVVTPPEPEDTVQTGPPPQWRTEDGRAGDEKVIDRIISTLAGLKCDGYIGGRTKDDFADPVCIITVECSERVSLSIFEKRDDNKHPAVSSQNDYPFLLPEWRVKQIMKKPEELVVKDPGK